MAKAQAKQKKAAPKKTAAKPIKKVQKVIQKKVAKKVTRKPEAKKKAPVKKAPVAKPVKKQPAAKVAAPAKKVVPKKKAAPAKKQIPKQAKVTKEAKEVDTSDKVLKPVKPKADPNKVPAKFASYSQTQYQEYLTAIKNWSNKTNQEIKDNLRKNFQSMTGNKDELLNKIADGIVLGQIPRCPNCFGGRPKYNQATGTYFCVGYRDDTDFKWCNKTITTLERAPWQL